jgi:transposase
MKQEKSWEMTDSFWEAVQPLLTYPQRDNAKQYQRKPGGGRKPLDLRQVLSGIFYVLRTGCQWCAVPKEYGAKSSIHRYFQLWVKDGVFMSMWQKGLMEYDEVKGIDWEWQSIDGSMVKSPLGQDSVGANPTDRGKKWDETPCFS